MPETKINGLTFDRFTEMVYSADHLLNGLGCRPPEGFSLERLLFLRCAVEPLLELFFCSQHFEGSYSAWVDYKLRSFRLDLPAPGPEAAGYFAQEVASADQVRAFLSEKLELADLTDYIAAGAYRKELQRLAAKAREPYAGHLGDALLAGLGAHAFLMKPAEACKLWGEIRRLPGRIGEEYRRAFLDGGYHWELPDKDFVEFILSASTYAGAGAAEKKLIYGALAARRYIFEGAGISRRLWEIFAGPLRDWADSFETLCRGREDFLGALRSENPEQLRGKVGAVMAQLAFAEGPFFYLKDFGPTGDSDFDGFDEKMDEIVALLKSVYLQAPPEDLWLDKNFKFLYLMSALWFRHCFNKRV